ncbi:MAG: immunity 17 family protein [Ruminococcus sp.]|nr:immunity 17 family protein [Ruminococcus sp.]
MEITFAIIIIALGAFSLAGGVYNWDWFMNNYKVRRFVNAFGRKVTRVIYGFIGSFLMIIGIIFLIVYL